MATSLINVRFGLAVKREREKRGLSQRALGDMLGLSQTFVYDIESARSDIPLSKIGLICEYFGVGISEMDI